MSIRRSLALLAVPAAALALTATPALASTASTTAHHAAPRGTEIIVADTAFGHSLAVGSGPFKNFTLYYISSDHGHSYGCTTGATSTPVGPITCTGPSNDRNAEWPAITTNGKPIAGPGVSRALLGRVFRKGVGWQVTYAGHPLYLFDQQPGAVTGEGWFEPGLPPWHGIWWLMSPGGQPVPWAGTLTTAKVGGQTVLAEPFMTGIGWVKFPVYTFSGDLGSYRHDVRRDLGLRPCLASAVHQRITRLHRRPGLRHRRGRPARGPDQVTWNGHPLYLFSLRGPRADVERRRRARGQRQRDQGLRRHVQPGRQPVTTTKAGWGSPEADPSGFRMS